METKVLIRYAPKPNTANPLPHWWYLWNLIKIGSLALEIYLFKCVDDRRRTTNARALLYYKLTLWAFGSGELKMINPHDSNCTISKESYVTKLGLELATHGSAIRCATDCAVKPELLLVYTIVEYTDTFYSRRYALTLAGVKIHGFQKEWTWRWTHSQNSKQLTCQVCGPDQLVSTD